MYRPVFQAFLNPVWLLFIPPLVGRAFLLTRTITPGYSLMSWMIYTLHILLLLFLVVLVGRIAVTLAAMADLSERAHERFMVMSALGTLAPPLSLAVAESSLRLDFIACLTLTLWLISSSLCIRQSLETRASFWQGVYHWACRGLASGLLLWLRPLLLLSLIAVIFCLAAFRFARNKPGPGYVPALLAFLTAGIIGSLPIIFWPISDRHFINLTLSIPGHTAVAQPIVLIALLYVLGISTAGLLLALGSNVLALWWSHPICLRLCRLTSPFLLFYGGTLIVCIISFLASDATNFPEDSLLILAVALPFFNAAIFILPYLVTQYRDQMAQTHDNYEDHNRKQKNIMFVFHVVVIVIIALYFISQIYTYILWY